MEQRSRNPYQAPAATVADIAQAGGNPVLARWVIWSLYAQIAVLVVAVISGLLENSLLNDYSEGVYASESDATVAGEMNDYRQMVVAGVQTLTFLASGILILVWIYRANVNARQLGAWDLTISPGWSVGWYFIPIANLWKPFQALKQIWQASENPREWQTVRVSPLLNVWWFFWIATNLLSNATLRMSLQAEELDQLKSVNNIILVSDALSIPLCAVFLLIVSRVESMQEAAAVAEINSAKD